MFDDPAHGRGMAVLLRRRDDGRLDIYRQPGLTLGPEMAQVGGELGEWRESPIDPARFEISPDGVDLDVGFTDVADRPVQVRIDDRNGRPRHRATLLAPVGSVIEDPASLSLFVMGGCDLVRRSGRAFDVRIDGRPVATGRLPVGWLHRRRLVKYTADPTVVVCNQAHDGPVATVDPRHPARSRSIHGRAGSRPSGLATAVTGPASSWPRPSTSPTSGRGRPSKEPGSSASIATRPSLAGSGPPSGARMSSSSSWTSCVAGGRPGCRQSWRR